MNSIIEFHQLIKKRLVKSIISTDLLTKMKLRSVTNGELKQLALEVEKKKAVQQELKSILLEMGPTLMQNDKQCKEWGRFETDPNVKLNGIA